MFFLPVSLLARNRAIQSCPTKRFSGGLAMALLPFFYCGKRLLYARFRDGAKICREIHATQINRHPETWKLLHNIVENVPKAAVLKYSPKINSNTLSPAEESTNAKNGIMFFDGSGGRNGHDRFLGFRARLENPSKIISCYRIKQDSRNLLPPQTSVNGIIPLKKGKALIQRQD